MRPLGMNGIPSIPRERWSLGEVYLPGLLSEPQSTPTGLKDEIILLSWLIVLLRVKEDRQASYDWMYRTREPENKHRLSSGYLSTSQVIANLKSNVREATTAVSTYLSGITLNSQVGHPGSMSLILNTECQPKDADERESQVRPISTSNC